MPTKSYIPGTAPPPRLSEFLSMLPDQKRPEAKPSRQPVMEPDKQTNLEQALYDLLVAYAIGPATLRLPIPPLLRGEAASWDKGVQLANWLFDMGVRGATGSAILDKTKKTASPQVANVGLALELLRSPDVGGTIGRAEALLGPAKTVAGGMKLDPGVVIKQYGGRGASHIASVLRKEDEFARAIRDLTGDSSLMRTGPWTVEDLHGLTGLESMSKYGEDFLATVLKNRQIELEARELALKQLALKKARGSAPPPPPPPMRGSR